VHGRLRASLGVDDSNTRETVLDVTEKRWDPTRHLRLVVTGGEVDLNDFAHLGELDDAAATRCATTRFV
jgi:hypothetical protein